MNNPRVSVILAVYNGEETVREAVRSTLSQSESNLEMIVVDDCSSDATADILAEFSNGDSRMSVLRNTRRMGVSRSLRRGAAQARGRFISRIDADDVSEIDRLRIQCDALDSSPDVVLVSCWSAYSFAPDVPESVRDAFRNIERVRRARFSGEFDLNRVIFKKNLIYGPEVTFRTRSYLDVGGYVSWMDGAEDYDLWLRLSSTGRLTIIDRELITRNITTSGATLSGLRRNRILARLARLRNSPNSRVDEHLVADLAKAVREL